MPARFERAKEKERSKLHYILIYYFFSCVEAERERKGGVESGVKQDGKRIEEKCKEKRREQGRERWKEVESGGERDGKMERRKEAKRDGKRGRERWAKIERAKEVGRRVGSSGMG